MQHGCDLESPFSVRDADAWRDLMVGSGSFRLEGGTKYVES